MAAATRGPSPSAGVLALVAATAAGEPFTSMYNLVTQRIYFTQSQPSAFTIPAATELFHDDLVPAIVVAVAILTSTLAGLTAVTTRWIVERKQQAADRDYRPPPSQTAPEPVVGNPSPSEGSHAND